MMTELNSNFVVGFVRMPEQLRLQLGFIRIIDDLVLIIIVALNKIKGFL